MGSPLMQVTADATLPGALGSFAYEDEGTPAHSVDIVRDGTWWVGVLSSRDTAALAGVPNGGMVRADGHDRIPMVRMTNIGLLPGQHSLEQMIAETDDGIFMDTNRSWSIDDRRLNFQFGCRSHGRSRTGPWEGCCATRLIRGSAPSSGAPSTWSGAQPSGGSGGRPTAERDSRCKLGTLATLPSRAASATCAPECADNRRARMSGTDPASLAGQVLELVGGQADAAVTVTTHGPGPHPVR